MAAVVGIPELKPARSNRTLVQRADRSRTIASVWVRDAHPTGLRIYGARLLAALLREELRSVRPDHEAGQYDQIMMTETRKPRENATAGKKSM
jgi:hypothetical protein